MVDRDHPFSFRTSKEELESYKRAAERAKLSASEWARLVLSAASGASEMPRQFLRVIEIEEKPVRDGEW